jgi:hypothetical protein
MYTIMQGVVISNELNREISLPLRAFKKQKNMDIGHVKSVVVKYTTTYKLISALCESFSK